MTRECPDCGAELQVVTRQGFGYSRCPWTRGAWWTNLLAAAGIAACGRPYQRSRDAGWIER